MKKINSRSLDNSPESTQILQTATKLFNGSKKVYINGKLNVLGPNNGIHIPKGALHEVLNIKNTWALSIGYD